MRFVIGPLFQLFARHADAGIHPHAAQEITRDKETEPVLERRMQSKRGGHLTTTFYPVEGRNSQAKWLWRD